MGWGLENKVGEGDYVSVAVFLQNVSFLFVVGRVFM